MQTEGKDLKWRHYKMGFHIEKKNVTQKVIYDCYRAFKWEERKRDTTEKLEKKHVAWWIKIQIKI